MKDLKQLGSFDLGGITWEVVAQDRPELHGECQPDLARIIISTRSDPKLKQHTFYHELTHAILHTMNHELWDNEEFVNTFATFLHQAMASKKSTSKKVKSKY